MYKQKESEKKVYKGIFISNERKKRAGGRIKCEEFKNKIEVMGRNQAIHQSEVEWTEVRRYKREKREKKTQPKKQEKSKEQIVKKDKIAKFKEKDQIKYEEENNKKQVKEEKKSQNNDQNSKTQQKPAKKKYYKVKPQSEQTPISKQNQPKQQLQEDNNDTKQEQTIKQKFESTKQKIKQQKETINQIPQREVDQQLRKQQENPIESQSQQEQQQLQVIVGKIKKQTNIKFSTKPFVGILYFQKRRKAKNNNDKFLNNPIEQIMSDYFADLHPIHSRLPIMQLDDLNLENYSILNDYASKTVADYNQKTDKTNIKKHLNNILDQLSSVYILMTFSEWDGDQPLANIHKIIGKAMTIDGQCERFLYQHGLNGLHYQEIETQSIPINPTALHKRVDKLVFTIDPPTSTDLDDALSIQKIDENIFSVGIHIADVTSYLNLIDRQQLIKRTTSVYLPYNVYHMLNKNLVKVCSLDPGVQRLAFTVWVLMDREGNILGDSIVQKSIIKSRYKLSYGVVQDLITGEMEYDRFNQKYPCSKEEYEELLEKLLVMVDISTAHRSQRIVFDVFENRELQFELDQNRWPIKCYVDKRYTAKKMVQEFMIIGNIQSAKFIIKSHPQNALVIHHPKPSKLAVTQFNEQFKHLQTKFKFDNVLDVQKQLKKIQQNPDIQNQIKSILFFKARRSMEPAIYRKYADITEEAKQNEKEKPKGEKDKQNQAEEYPIIHFALGLQFYTHFTSPMRRMADILVHQTLTQIISQQKVTNLSSAQIQKINNGRRNTKRLKKDLNEVYICLMILHTNKPMQCQGIISSFGLQSVSIYIPLFDMQKQVLWKRQFSIYSIKRIRNVDNKMDVKLYHDKKTAKKDIYWVIERFQKVKLTLDCTRNPPLKLIADMTVQSEKGEFTIKWLQD